MNDCLRAAPSHGLLSIFLSLSMLLCSLLVCSPGSAEDPFFVEASEKQSIEQLQTSTSVFEKAKACQRLAVVGGPESVPVLAALLDDTSLSGYARTALERIPGDEAGQALVDALERLQGRLLIGVIDSIGERNDSNALPALQKRIERELDGQTGISRRFAETALRVLRRLGESGPDRGTRSGLRGLNEQLMTRVTEQSKVERSGQGDMPTGSDFVKSLTRAREAGPAAAPSLAKRLGEMSASEQIVAMSCLGDLGNRKVVESVQPLLASPNSEVASAAFDTLVNLGRFDQRSSLPEALNDRPEIAPRGFLALAARSEVTLDHAVVEQLEKSSAADAPEWVRGLGNYAAARHLEAATEPLIRLARTSENELQLNCLVSAGSTTGSEQFPDLLDALGALLPSLSDATAQKALERALVRLPPTETASAIEVFMLMSTPQDYQALMQQLAFLGGAKALSVVASEAQSGEEDRLDAATRALGQWPTAEVAETLRQLVDEIDSPKYQLRVLRGYLRVLRQFELPPEDRTRRAIEAFSMSSRQAERELVFDVLRRHPTLSGLEWLVQRLTADSELSNMERNQAFRTMMAVADRVADDSPREALAALARLDAVEAGLNQAQRIEVERFTRNEENRLSGRR